MSTLQQKLVMKGPANMLGIIVSFMFDVSLMEEPYSHEDAPNPTFFSNGELQGMEGYDDDS